MREELESGSGHRPSLPFGEIPHVAIDDETTPLPPTDESRALVRAIELAFRGVSREGGVSWRKATMFDLKELNEWEIEDLFVDSDGAWSDLLPNRSWRPDMGVGGWAFLDPVGFRYYLPAAMIRAIATPWDVDFAFWLTPRGADADWHREKWSLFDREQLAVVTRFIRFMAGHTDIEGFEGWGGAYRAEWRRYDPLGEPPR